MSLDQIIEPIDASSPDDSPETEGWSRLRATVQDTQQLQWWLRGLGDGVRVLSMNKPKSRPTPKPTHEP